jgi:hypothetical protein
VTGRLAPETVKPLPLIVAALTVTAELPVDDRVTDWVAGVFNPTSPKAKVVALTLKIGPVGEGTPVPFKFTAVGVAGAALLITVSCPLAVPVDVGLNWIVTFRLPFAPIVVGMLLWLLAENDCPLTLTCEIWTDDFP